MNRSQIIGNVGQAPELKKVGADSSLLKFSVAVNESYTDKATGEKKESTTWINVSVWGKQAEYLSANMSKGSRVFVEGKIKVNKFTDKSGVEKTGFEIQASTVQVLASFKGKGGDEDAHSED